jgi:threonine dehydrogenase-like Zn-dependent dehydrogenase
MRRFAAGVAVAIMALGSLTGCGQSDYCKAVETHEDTLNTLGQNKSTAGYRKYVRALRAVANVAPPGVRKDWITLADATDGVLRAHAHIGLPLEASNSQTFAKLSADQLRAVNTAYEAFNNTGDERKAVVKNVKAECEITLS